MHQSDAALQKWFKKANAGSQLTSERSAILQKKIALKNPFYEPFLTRHKQSTAHIHAPLHKSGNRFRESRLNPNVKESIHS